MSEGKTVDNIQVTAVVPLSSKIRKALVDRAAKLLDKHRHCFGSVLLHLYVKNANSRIGCTANLFTDDGRYHAYVEDWDVQRVVASALETIHVQIVKHFEKRADVSRQMMYA